MKYTENEIQWRIKTEFIDSTDLKIEQYIVSILLNTLSA